MVNPGMWRGIALATLIGMSGCGGQPDQFDEVGNDEVGNDDVGSDEDVGLGQVEQAVSILSTQVLTFNLPLNPKPNAGNNSSVMHTSNGWTLQVRKTGSNRDINTSLKTVNVTLNSAHYSAFCGAFQGNSGTKSATVNYTGSIVNSLGWDSTIITLPDP